MSTPKPLGPYSPIRRVGDLLICSGQVGLKDGVMAEGFEAQTRQVIENLKSVFATEGASLEQIVKTTVFLSDIGNYSEMNSIYMEYFTSTPPARSAVAVAALPLNALIEIEAIAHVG